ncbi:hybrid sensor histidine kinase/response regulator [Gloeomargarita sp.]
MMIEDEELRSLYQASSEKHLAKLESGLLFLEKHPQDKSRLPEMLRTAHSLKGDSRMLGVKDAERLTHSFEEILSRVHKGQLTLSPAILETLFKGLDGIKRIATEAVTGQPAQVSVFHLLAEMMTAMESQAIPEGQSLENTSSVASPASEENLSDLIDSTPENRNFEQENLEIPAPPSPSEPSSDLFESELQSDTIHVKASKLDTLAQYAGELTLIQQRLERQIGFVSSAGDLWGSTLQKGKSPVNLDRLGEVITKLQNNLEHEISRLGTVTNLLEQNIKELQLVPFSIIFNLFHRTVRDIAKQQNKEVDFVITGGEALVDRKILEEIKDPITHLLRNAIDHGIETPEERMRCGKPPQGKLHLRAAVAGNEIIIEVGDDGRGLNLEAIGAVAVSKGLITPAELAAMTPSDIEQFIFRHGFSTKSGTEVSEISGRGIGLDVVRETVERLQGQIKIQSQPGLGCTFKLFLRTKRSIISVLVIKEDNYYYALPTDAVITTLLVKRDDIFLVEDRPAILWQDQVVKIIFLADILQGSASEIPQSCTCVILRIDEQIQGLVVGSIVDYQEVHIKPHPFVIPQLLGVTMLEDGTICQVLHPAHLLSPKNQVSFAPRLFEEKEPAKLLLVEDSIPIRTQLRRILEGAGYRVTVAVDGQDGLEKLQQDSFDAIISDVEMPNLSGIEMTEAIRATMPNIPIILVTTLAKPSDRERGLRAGANAYITKGEFDQSLLLNTLRRLIR